MILIIAIVILIACATIIYFIIQKDFDRAKNSASQVVSLCRENIGIVEASYFFDDEEKMNALVARNIEIVGAKGTEHSNKSLLGGVGTRGTARGQVGMITLPSEIYLATEYVNSSESRF